MTSILTNMASISALQTLRSIGSSLGQVQNQVNSGYRIADAADNVAYWSISVTMKSDNKAIGAAQDAMGLGAAKTDTAYAGTEGVIDVLTEFKAKLATAKETSVDRAQVQLELKKLSEQAEGIVNSASFSGTNWLKTDSATHIQDVSELKDTVVSGFVRNADNSIAVTSSDIDLRYTSMLNSGGGGILQKDILDYYMPLGEMSSYTYYHEGHEDHMFHGPVTFDNTETVTFKLVVDRSTLSPGEEFPIVVDKSVVDAALGTTDGIIANLSQVKLVLQKAFENAGAAPYADVYSVRGVPVNSYGIQSLETSPHVGSSIYIENLVDPLQKLGLNSIPVIDHDNMNTSSVMNFLTPFKVMYNATIAFDVSIDGAPSSTYIIDRNAVDAALGTTDGMINSANELKTIVQSLTGGIGLAIDVTGNQMVFSPDQAIYPGYGNKAAAFAISQFRPDPPFTLRFDLSEIDITTDAFTIDDYLEGVESMLKDSIVSGNMLGSLQKRTELQNVFSGRLSDSIDIGVGRLIDADMEEASARLQALQTQEQLAVQTLQIANGNAENILQLFQ